MAQPAAVRAGSMCSSRVAASFVAGGSVFRRSRVCKENTPGIDAWCFLPNNGVQSKDREGSPLFAMAVRPGDVVADVP